MNEECIDGYRLYATKILGSGSFASVYQGLRESDGKTVAIKRIIMANQKEPKRVCSEIEMMQKINHPNIVAYYHVVRGEKIWYIMMEYCDRGTLDDVIKYVKTKKNASLDSSDIFSNIEKDVHYYLVQLKDALSYIREMGMIHRDIKPPNILLTTSEADRSDELGLDLLFAEDSKTNYSHKQNLIVKLADFGLAKEVNGADMMKQTHCGTPFYMAPELLNEQPYNSKADLWSYGVLMYELLFQRYPIEATTLPQLKLKLKELTINFNNNSQYTPECIDLLCRLLHKDPAVRITWENFFNHSWFNYWNRPDHSDMVDQAELTRSVSVSPIISASPMSPSSLSRTPSNLSRMKLHNFDVKKDYVTEKEYKYSLSKTPKKTYSESAHQSVSLPPVVSGTSGFSAKKDLVKNAPVAATVPSHSVSCPVPIEKGGQSQRSHRPPQPLPPLSKSGVIRGPVEDPKSHKKAKSPTYSYSPRIIENYPDGRHPRS